MGPHVESGAVVRTGIVLPNKHPSDPTAYYVNFGEKTASQDGRLDSGIWCSNGISTYVRYRDATNTPIAYGSHIPIQPYSPVNVLMANGGKGSPVIIGFATTNTSTPDIENVDGLHVLGLTPKGSTIELDDQAGAIRLMYNKGNSVVALSEDAITLEIMDGHKSGKILNTGITMRKGGISLKLKDSMMQFDETGLSVSFDDGGTSMKVTKKGVTFEGMEVFKVASEEQVSIKGSKMTLEGTKDASLAGNEVKVGGKTLTNLTGAQINMEAAYGVTIKSMTGINLWALGKIQELCALKDENHLMMHNRTCGVSSEASSSHNVVTGLYNIGAGSIAMDFSLKTNMGLGMAGAASAYTAGKAAMIGTHAAFTALGTAMLTKAVPIVGTNKIIADLFAGTSETAQEPSGNVSGARDKNDKKSMGSVAATRFIKNSDIMHNFSVAPNLLANSAGGASTSAVYLDQAPVGSATASTTPASSRQQLQSKVAKFSGKSQKRPIQKLIRNKR